MPIWWAFLDNIGAFGVGSIIIITLLNNQLISIFYNYYDVKQRVGLTRPQIWHKLL